MSYLPLARTASGNPGPDSGHHLLAHALAQRPAWVPYRVFDPEDVPLTWREAHNSEPGDICWRFIPPRWEGGALCACCELRKASIGFLGTFGWTISEPAWPTTKLRWTTFGHVQPLIEAIPRFEAVALAWSDQIRRARAVYLSGPG
jgi:hypothetical protein